MYKKIISLLLITGILIASSVPINAEKDVDYVTNKLKTLEKKYGVEFYEIDDLTNNTSLITIKDFNEIENYLIAFKRSIEKTKKEAYSEDLLIVHKDKSEMSTCSINGSYTWTWWAPFSGWGLYGLACWKNISHNHSYDWLDGNPYFVSCSDIDSWISGISVAVGWVQKNAYYNIITTVNYNDTITNTVSGYFYLGFDINGFTIGAKINDTWPTKSLRIVAG